MPSDLALVFDLLLFAAFATWLAHFRGGNVAIVFLGKTNPLGRNKRGE